MTRTARLRRSLKSILLPRRPPRQGGVGLKFGLGQLRGLKLSPGGLWWPWTLVLTSTLAFSLATPFGKLIIEAGVSPPLILVLRFSMAIALLVGTLGITAPAKLRADARGMLIALFAGLENGIGVLTFFWALTRLEASVATMIFTLNPLVVLGLLALRGEKLTYRHLVRVALGLGGVYLVLGPGGGIDWIGALLVCVSICCVSFELVIIQWFLQHYDARTITLYVLTGMLTTITGYWLWQGAPWINLDWEVWLYLILLAVVCTYFAWWAMFSGLRQIGSGQVAMLVPLETLLTVAWSFILLGERFNVWQSMGAVLVLLSAILAIQRLGLAKFRPRWRAAQRL